MDEKTNDELLAEFLDLCSQQHEIRLRLVFAQMETQEARAREHKIDQEYQALETTIRNASHEYIEKMRKRGAPIQ